MNIIDRNTGKRLKETDPLTREGVKDLTSIENSPMDPPGAYDIPEESIAKEDFPAALQHFAKDFEGINSSLDNLESGFNDFVKDGYQFTDTFNESLKQFFQFYDDTLLPMLQLEQKTLFPVLHEQLMHSGEHSPGNTPKTAVDIMEDDYVKIIQLGTLVFNFLGLATRIRDEQARQFILETTGGNARELIELIRLHVFRKENVLYPLAIKLVTSEQMEGLYSKIKGFQ